MEGVGFVFAMKSGLVKKNVNFHSHCMQIVRTPSFQEYAAKKNLHNTSCSRGIPDW